MNIDHCSQSDEPRRSSGQPEHPDKPAGRGGDPCEKQPVREPAAGNPRHDVRRRLY
jgi:hypothetical protein